MILKDPKPVASGPFIYRFFRLSERPRAVFRPFERPCNVFPYFRYADGERPVSFLKKREK